MLDPDVLTIGFARRVPSYKRLTLMMRDPARLKALLLHPTRPIQIVVAGKSHPADDGGKKLIQQLVQFTDDPEVRHRIVFLPDYDIAMAQNLYPGCDVWLNNPLRPLEACGTSGMKAALNGCLNLSILDGWWDEMYDGQNGWAIPTADGVEDPERRDDLEAAALYDLIEGSVSGRFYDRDGEGNPPRWLAMVRHTLTTLGPKVLASRMVRDYVETLYSPSALSAREVDGPGYELAVTLATWKDQGHPGLVRGPGRPCRDLADRGRPGAGSEARPARVRLARDSQDRRTYSSRWCTAGSTTTTGSSCRPSPCSTLRRRTRTAAGATRGPSRSSGPAPSATRSACSRTTTCWRARQR